MLVRFNYPAGSQGWEEEVELPIIPRKGEIIDKDGDEYIVRTIVHYPFEDPQLVYLVVNR